MIKLDKNKFRVIFDENVIETLKNYQQKNGEPESGGILIGEIYPNSSKVIVKKVIVSKKAKRTFMGIIVDKKEMQKELDKIREESGYTLSYLGDWHTHPEPFPKPSYIDKRSFIKTCKNATIQTNFIIFLIIGNHSNIYKSSWVKTYFFNK